MVELYFTVLFPMCILCTHYNNYNNWVITSNHPEHIPTPYPCSYLILPSKDIKVHVLHNTFQPSIPIIWKLVIFAVFFPSCCINHRTAIIFHHTLEMCGAHCIITRLNHMSNCHAPLQSPLWHLSVCCQGGRGPFCNRSHGLSASENAMNSG